MAYTKNYESLTPKEYKEIQTRKLIGIMEEITELTDEECEEFDKEYLSY